jgi:AbrB family looped-hinge helix DNA binding protein
MKSAFAIVTSTGAVTIPAQLRRKFGLGKGTRVVVMEEENRIILHPLTGEYIRRLRGSLKGEPSALAYLFENRKQRCE